MKEDNECAVCAAGPTKGGIPEAFTDVCMATTMARATSFNLCIEHYGRLFWSGTAYAEVPVHG